VTRRTLWLGGLLVLGAIAAGWYLLITPSNPVTRMFRRSIADVDARIVTGPYPDDSDLALLKQHQVTLVVTLLNPAIPYEATLLQREQTAASRLGLTLRNFPMSSILGQRFGEDYDRNAAAAAEAIASTSEKVYLHCYLGMHRVKAVRELLATKGVDTSTYAVKQGDRTEGARLLDAAEAEYQARRYAEAIEILGKINPAETTDAARLLRGWSHYREGDIAAARDAFTEAARANPGSAQPSIGLGYCAYRAGDYATAEAQFTSATRALPNDADALAGLGLTLFALGRPSEAEQSLEAALKIAPENQDVRQALERIRSAKKGRASFSTLQKRGPASFSLG
jgi:tetratricopeptide (TPR) repeat protein